MKPEPTSLVISNTPVEHAEEIARTLVERQAAACVTLSPVKSVYRWEGQVCVDEEVTLTAKVSESCVTRCVQVIESLHPYDLPEILVLSVDHKRSSYAYQSWVAAECKTEVKQMRDMYDECK